MLQIKDDCAWLLNYCDMHELPSNTIDRNNFISIFSVESQKEHLVPQVKTQPLNNDGFWIEMWKTEQGVS